MEDKKDSWRMHVPPAYEATDPEATIRRYPFAWLVSQGPHGPFATWTAMFWEGDSGDAIVGHIARANPHADALEDGSAALAIFSGPHAYISAGWYRERPTVPTWNYVAAQARGKVELLKSREQRLAVLDLTALTLESDHKPPWRMDDAPEGRVDALLEHILAFRIRIARVDGADKLSQAQPQSDQLRVIEALRARGGSGDADVAAMMEALLADRR